MAFAAPFTTLWLVGRARTRLESVADIARQAGANVRCVPMDLVKDEEVRGLAACLHREVGYLDILVHSAGEIVPARFESAAIADLDRQFQINVRAPYLLTQALLPLLRKCRGQVVFVNSSAGRNAPAGISQYGATKHALRAVADSLRHEVNADGIRVLSIYPGRTASPMQAAVHALEGRKYDPERLLQAGDVAQAVVAALRLPASAEITDLDIRPVQKPF